MNNFIVSWDENCLESIVEYNAGKIMLEKLEDTFEDVFDSSEMN